MKIIGISDTHGKHHELEIPAGDILIHAGDISSRGGHAEVQDFLQWYASLPHRHKVFIAGNHDFMAERQPEVLLEMIPDNLIYLNDSGVTIEGINIWGSPISPWFYDWAFNRRRGLEIKYHWDMIPDNTDILVTHGPPHGILDRTYDGSLVGCEELRIKVMAIRPRLHLFGHIHEAHGLHLEQEITFANASILDLAYEVAHPPVEIDWK